jgi:hypothetical protein
MKIPHRERGWTRRAFLVLGAAGMAAISTAVSWHRWRNIGALRHEPGTASTDDPNEHVLRTVTEFTAAIFGVTLSDDDRKDLGGRFSYAARKDSGWRNEYRWLSAYLDSLAEDAGLTLFVDVPSEQKEQIMRLALAIDESSRAQRFHAFLRADGKKLMRMRKSTFPHLAYVYQHSGVPWRHRGYKSWPGRPGDRLAYTRPVDAPTC